MIAGARLNCIAHLPSAIRQQGVDCHISTQLLHKPLAAPKASTNIMLLAIARHHLHNTTLAQHQPDSNIYTYIIQLPDLEIASNCSKLRASRLNNNCTAIVYQKTQLMYKQCMIKAQNTYLENITLLPLTQT